MPSAEIQELKYKALSYFWGFESLRNPQSEIIDEVLAGRDIVALLPTGAGKSLCYQLPALLLQGTCLVVSPLLALMKDQVRSLKSRGIEAELVSSETDEGQVEQIYSACKDGLTKILYVSPERLTNAEFIRNSEEIQLSFIAVDEAHCISEWGQDFRPAYQDIAKFRERFPKVPVIALTATATPNVLKEISEKLNLKKPLVFQKSFKRENIKIISEEISDKYTFVKNFLLHNTGSGIIYTSTRKDAEYLADYLQKKGIKNTEFYHAGLKASTKNERQREWLNGTKSVLISTNAFGMGIDKPDVRFVIHFSPPPSLENYYQEIGRAGRDGLPSFAFLLWNKQELANFDEILAYSMPSRQEFERIISCLYSIFQIADGEVSEKSYSLPIQKIKEKTGCSMAKVKNVLNFLHHQEIINYRKNKSLSTVRLNVSAEEIDLLPPQDGYFVELLLRNIPGCGNGKSVLFSETKLAEKTDTEANLIKERLRELQTKCTLEYVDGAIAGIRFLKPRDHRSITGSYWTLFLGIQKNKLQKWEEMKFYTTDRTYCKMRLILGYFGEENAKNCGSCSVCERRHEKIFGTTLPQEILQVLEKNPAEIDKICAELSYRSRDKILENLILLLDAGKVKMLDFRTYTLA